MKAAIILRTGVLGGVALAALGFTPAALISDETAYHLVSGGTVVACAVGSWWLHRWSIARAAAERPGDSGLAAVLAASGYRLDEPPAPLPPAVPDFAPVVDDGVVTPRDGRQMHHDVWQLVADPRLQADLDRVDDAPGFTDPEREWMRRVVLNGTPVDQVLDRNSWTRQQRRKPRTNGGRK